MNERNPNQDFTGRSVPEDGETKKTVFMNPAGFDKLTSVDDLEAARVSEGKTCKRSKLRKGDDQSNPPARNFMDITQRLSGLIFSRSMELAIKLKNNGARLDNLIQDLAGKLKKDDTDPVYCRNTAIALDRIINELAAITMELDNKPLDIRKELDKMKEKTWTIAEALDEYCRAKYNISVKQT